MKEQAILVTGAHGFLGRHAARHFANRGFPVCGIGHGQWQADEWRKWGMTAWYEDDINVETLRRYGGTPFALIHCAGSGSVPFSLQSPGDDFQRTVAATLGVLEFVRLFSPRTCVVYPSSASIYGVAEQSPIPETCHPAPVSPYGVHKHLAEQLVAEFARHFGVAASIVRLFSVYGNGLRKQLLWDGCRKLSARQGLFMGTGDEIRDWLHVEDAVDLLATAALNADSHCPVVNGGTGEGITTKEILLSISRNLQLPAAGVTFSGTQRPGDPTSYIADIAAARKWGWSPKKSWQQGIQEYCEWWLQDEKADSESKLVVSPMTALTGGKIF